MSIIHSHNLVLDSIFINNTGNSAQSCEDSKMLSWVDTAADAI
jgi:hypothetical protein